MKQLHTVIRYCDKEISLTTIIDNLDLEEHAIYGDWASGWNLRLVSMKKTKGCNIYKFEVWGETVQDQVSREQLEEESEEETEDTDLDERVRSMLAYIAREIPIDTFPSGAAV